MFKTIMIPTDGSKFASKAEDIAISIAQKFESKIIAVYIIDEKLLYPFDVLEEEGKSILTKVIEKGKKKGIKIDQVMIVGDPAHDMPKIVNRLNADIVIIGTHGKTGLEKLLLGSVAENTLNSVKVPVLLVK
jgi:nucleotide-binding universal stress UspA family protein